MRRTVRSSHDPAEDVEWEVWYRDTFDRECPPSVDVRGRGLVAGLTELWARHLFETVRPDGGKGFSRFHLWYPERSVEIDGDWQGAIRLREWVFGSKRIGRKGYVQEGDARLLRQIAVAHAHLVLAGQTGERILATAADAADRRDFEARLWKETSENSPG
jgi:hypothetical protein